MNGTVEAANKNIKKILVKMTDTYKDWHEYLPFALCTYHTSVRTSTSVTPYSLVLGSRTLGLNVLELHFVMLANHDQNV